MTNIGNETLSKATFAGGCFWCMEPPFAELEGVESIYPGYTGGEVENPVYEAVVAGKTGHVEAVQIEFDEQKVSYNTLLDIYWTQIDPTDPDGQFADRGEHYRTIIFYHSEQQKMMAEQSKKTLQDSGIFKKPIVTLIKEASEFYPAEDYHQQYYKKNPLRYKLYKYGSGRDQFIEKVWNSKEKK